jgi:hypothetical protein
MAVGGTRRLARRRRPRAARLLLWPAIGLAVALVFLPGFGETLRNALSVLASARWDRLLDSPEAGRDLSTPELEARILALLAPSGTAEDGGAARVSHRFEDCTLVVRQEFEPQRCAGEDAGSRPRGVEERVSLGWLLTHPAFVPAGGRLLPGADGAEPREEVRWQWRPRARRELELETAGYLLLDVGTLRALSAEETGEEVDETDREEALAALARSLSADVESGALGPFTVGTHRRIAFCDGSEAVQPLALDGVSVSAPAGHREELIALVHARARRDCPGGGWLFRP